ncbi:MAG: transporter substrate-binding domain-containing protein [Pseudomonadota bacterium]
MRWIAGLFALSVGLFSAPIAPAQTVPAEPSPTEAEATDGRMQRVLDRGRLIVGVKTDYPPWGMIAPDGSIAGLEPDLAQDLADRLGVALELVPVTSANRLQRLNQGVIDIAIATMGDTEARRREADLLLPHYYASGVTLLARRGSPFRDWGQLRGRPICLTDGAFFNRRLTEIYHIQTVVFRGNRDALLALQDGRCVGMAYDDTVLTRHLNDPLWSDFHLATPSILNSPWSIAVKLGEGERALGRFVSDAIATWHRDGILLALQDRWGIPRSDFLTERNRVWRAERAGEPVCIRGTDGAWPASCLSTQAFKTSGDTSELPGWVKVLRDKTGFDLSFAFDQIDSTRLIHGVGLTFVLSLIAILGSLTVGVTLAIASRSLKPNTWAHWLFRNPIRALVVSARMTPPILQLYILFFGLGGYLAAHYGYTPGSFGIAALVLSFYAGATNAVLLGSAIGHLQEEKPGIPAYRLLPPAVERCYEGLVSTSVNIVKAAGLASTIALPEVISTVNTIIAEGGDATTMMNLLLVFYFLFVLSVLALLRALKGVVMRWI